VDAGHGEIYVVAPGVRDDQDRPVRGEVRCPLQQVDAGLAVRQFAFRAKSLLVEPAEISLESTQVRSART
jgi:hypothetical protein